MKRARQQKPLGRDCAATRAGMIPSEPDQLFVMQQIDAFWQILSPPAREVMLARWNGK